MLKIDKDTDSSGPWMTKKQASVHLNVSTSTIYNLEKQGLLKAYRIGSGSKRPILRFKQEDLDSLFLKRERGRPRQEVA